MCGTYTSFHKGKQIEQASRKERRPMHNHVCLGVKHRASYMCIKPISLFPPHWSAITGYQRYLQVMPAFTASSVIVSCWREEEYDLCNTQIVNRRPQPWLVPTSRIAVMLLWATIVHSGVWSNLGSKSLIEYLVGDVSVTRAWIDMPAFITGEDRTSLPTKKECFEQDNDDSSRSETMMTDWIKLWPARRQKQIKRKP